jgi:hypothetical protein
MVLLFVRSGKMKKLKPVGFLSLLAFLSVSAGAALFPPESELSGTDVALAAEIEIEENNAVSHPELFATRASTARLRRILNVYDDGGWFPQEGETFTIRSLGGEVGDVGVLYPGLPRPLVGISYRAKLKRGRDSFEFASGSESLKPLTQSRGYSRNRTDGSNGSGTGAFLFWGRNYMPVPYFISAPTFSGSSSFVTAVDLAFQSWRNPGNVTLEFLPMGCTSVASNRNDGINTIALVKSDWAFDTTAIAVTRNFYVSGNSGKAGLIVDTDILLNGVNYVFSTKNEPSAHDIQNIVTHEVGHFVGLGHEVDPKDIDATMFASASLGETKKRDLATSDLEGLYAAYKGVGSKIKTFSSLNGCSLENKPFSCLSVTHPKTKPKEFFGWLLVAIAVSLSMGRFVAARRLL